MLATNYKRDAIRYLECFEQFGDLNCAVVISPPDLRESVDDIDEGADDKVIAYWNKMMSRYGDADAYHYAPPHRQQGPPERTTKENRPRSRRGRSRRRTDLAADYVKEDDHMSYRQAMYDREHPRYSEPTEYITMEVDGLIVALRFKNAVTQPDTVSAIEQTLLMAQDFENLNKPA